MEENLISWILKDDEDILKRERIIKSIKNISDSGIHITIESLKKYLNKITKTTILSNQQENQYNKQTLELEIENNELLNQLQSLFEMYQNMDIFFCNFVYNRTHFIFKKHIRQINYNNYNNNITKKTRLSEELLKSKSNILNCCFHIIDNNKRLLIKKDNPPQNNNNNNNNGSGNLFLKIWRNLIIRKEILKYMELFRIHRFKMTFSSISQLDSYPFKEYLCNVQLEIGKGYKPSVHYLPETIEINEYLENNLPNSISVLNIIDLNKEFNNGYCRYIRPSSIPSSIKVLNFIKQDDYLRATRVCNLAQINTNNIINQHNNNNNNNNYNNGFITDDNNIFLEDEKNAIVISNSEQLIPDGVEYLNYEFNLEERSNLISFNNLPNSIKTLEIKRKLPLKISPQSLQDPIYILPNSIKILSFDLISTLKPNFIPQSITELYLGNAHKIYPSFKDNNNNDCLIEKGILPSQLKKLNLGGYVNEIKEGVLPPTLTSLTLCTTYKKTIKPGCLPQSLQYLSFQGDVVDEKNGEDKESSLLFSISSLFSMVTDLLLNNNLNQQQQCLIEGSIPIGLKTLKLSKHQAYQDILVKGILTPSHNSLTSISIVDVISDYNESTASLNQKNQQKLQKLKRHFFIPSSVKKFVGSIDNYCDPEISIFLPFTKVRNICFNPRALNLSNTVKSLSFKYNVLNYNSMVLTPNTITSLTLSEQEIDSHDLTTTNFFPQSLTYLDLTDDNFLSINSNPIEIFLPNLKTLILGNLFYREINIETSFPNLVTLVVGYSKPKIVLPTTTNLKEIIVFNSNFQFLNDNILKLQPFIKVYNQSIKKKVLKNFFLSNK
ncbi:hypothetical protein ACTFIU_000638 [Dictyostelium citrinum]